MPTRALLPSLGPAALSRPPFVRPSTLPRPAPAHLSRSPQVAEAETTLELSTNGQQFSSGGGGFAFHAMPIVSSATPASGPTGGATLVTVSGSKLDLGDRPAQPPQLEPDTPRVAASHRISPRAALSSELQAVTTRRSASHAFPTPPSTATDCAAACAR